MTNGDSFEAVFEAAAEMIKQLCIHSCAQRADDAALAHCVQLYVCS